MNQALYVFKKEFRELMRDRRVRTSAIVGPFLMVFLMMSTMGTAVKAATQPKSIKIHVVNPQPGNDVLNELEHPSQNPAIPNPGEPATIVPIASVDSGKTLVNDGKASLVVQFPDDYSDKLARGEQATVDAYFDDKSEKSQIAVKRFEEAVAVENAKHLGQLLAKNSISPNQLQITKVNSVDLMKGKGANEVLLSLIPYLVVFLAFVGGVSAAADLIAGEKERNTLETLLISPVPRTRIVLGKFLALATICLLSSMSGLIGILAAAYLKLPGSDLMFQNGAGIGPGTVASIVLIMIPTVALFASVLIAVSSYAKNTREAQTYLSLGSILVALPTVFSQFLGFTDFGSSRWINAIPILNASSAVRNALTGRLDATGLLLTAGVSTAIAIVGILIAVRLCNREQVLLRV